MIWRERLAVDAGWIGGRQVGQPPVFVLEGHLGVEPTDGRFMELDVSVSDSVLPPKGDFSLGRARLTNEPDFLSNFPAFDDLKPSLEELQRPVHRTVNTSGFSLRLDRAISWSFEAEARRFLYGRFHPGTP